MSECEHDVCYLGHGLYWCDKCGSVGNLSWTRVPKETCVRQPESYTSGPAVRALLDWFNNDAIGNQHVIHVSLVKAVLRELGVLEDGKRERENA